MLIALVVGLALHNAAMAQLWDLGVRGSALDMVAAWKDGDRKRALELAPDDLIREIFVFGSPEEQRARLDEFVAAGITTFVLTPITTPEDLPRMIGALAPSSRG